MIASSKINTSTFHMFSLYTGYKSSIRSHTRMRKLKIIYIHIQANLAVEHVCTFALEAISQKENPFTSVNVFVVVVSVVSQDSSM